MPATHTDGLTDRVAGITLGFSSTWTNRDNRIEVIFPIRFLHFVLWFRYIPDIHDEYDEFPNICPLTRQ